jgi:hypothetical protein
LPKIAPNINAKASRNAIESIVGANSGDYQTHNNDLYNMINNN